jgi:hypothetical protein
VLEIFTRYGHPVQILFFAAFLGWWLLGAAWLLRRAVRKHTEMKRQALGPCVLHMFLAGLGAAVVGFLTHRLALRITESPEIGTTTQILAAIPAVLTAIPMAFLVLYAALQVPLGRLLRAGWLPVGTVVLAGVVLGGPAFWLGWVRKVNAATAARSVANLRQIDQAIRLYEAARDRQPPDNLLILTLTRDLSDANRLRPPPSATRRAADPNRVRSLLSKSALECPFLPDEPVGYFYRPCPSLDPERDKLSQVLRACEWKHSHSDRYRSILLANGQAYTTRDEDFQRTLDANENTPFRDAYRAAEANRR